MITAQLINLNDLFQEAKILQRENSNVRVLATPFITCSKYTYFNIQQRVGMLTVMAAINTIDLSLQFSQHKK